MLAAVWSGPAAVAAPPERADGGETIPWSEMERFFAPPEEFRGKLGDLRPLLELDDGSPVETERDWSRRREEILKYWHGALGPWPPLIEKPRVKRLRKEHVESFTRHAVEVEVAPDTLAGPQFLLVPDGDGPFPAVLVTWYGSEDSAGLSEKARGTLDFGYQLAKRGFVALCIGALADDPARRIQPLSFLAYAAANCCRALSAMPEVDPRRIGIVGHSFGGKWAMFASCLHEGFACAVWVDPGIVWNEKDANADYWEKWYLGYDFDRLAGEPSREGRQRERRHPPEVIWIHRSLLLSERRCASNCSSVANCSTASCPVLMGKLTAPSSPAW